MDRPTALSVFSGDRLIGSLFDTEPLSFEYAKEWLQNAESVPLVNTPLLEGRMATPGIEAVFENLLPEGILRDLLSRETKSSTTFGLLLAVAGDTAGGLTILPAGTKPGAAGHEVVSWKYVADYFAGGQQAKTVRAPHGSRISLSGAQAKMMISIDTTGNPMVPLGTTPSTWIVKPNIRGFERVWNSAVNEAIMMRTATYCGLDAAEVFFEPVSKACIVKRFDRVPGPNDSVSRLTQYDFCQLSGTVSSKKYEVEGGPGIIQCAALIRQNSSKPALDLKRFYEWIFFNLYTGNNDSHAKNLSLYQVPGQGTRLTPFYDLMDTRMYPGLSRHFAFRIGGEDVPGKITKSHLEAMAEEQGLKPKFLLSLAQSLHAKLAPALQRAIDDFAPALDPSGKALAERLEQHVNSIANKNALRLVGGAPADPYELNDSPDLDDLLEEQAPRQDSPKG